MRLCSQEQYDIDRPKLNPRRRALINSFLRMSQEREVSNGFPRPIKDRDIFYHADKNGSAGLPIDLYLLVMRTVDNDYVERESSRIAKLKAKK